MATKNPWKVAAGRKAVARKAANLRRKALGGKPAYAKRRKQRG